jgi:hypothetical protein
MHGMPGAPRPRTSCPAMPYVFPLRAVGIPLIGAAEESRERAHVPEDPFFSLDFTRPLC